MNSVHYRPKKVAEMVAPPKKSGFSCRLSDFCHIFDQVMNNKVLVQFWIAVLPTLVKNSNVQNVQDEIYQEEILIQGDQDHFLCKEIAITSRLFTSEP